MPPSTEGHCRENPGEMADRVLDFPNRLRIEESLVRRQAMKQYDRVESLLHRQHQVKLGQKLEQLHPANMRPLLTRKLIFRLLNGTVGDQSSV